MNKPGITSYKHLDKIILDTLRDDKWMAAIEVYEKIEGKYQIKKILFTTRSIAHRIRKFKITNDIDMQWDTRRSIFLYKYSSK